MPARPHCLLLALATLLLFVQCQRPTGVLDDEQMKAVLQDIMMADAYSSRQSLPDSVAMQMYEGIFQKHGITKAVYDSSLLWYAYNAPRLNNIYTEIVEDLEIARSLLDTLYNDSLHYERLRFDPQPGLWGGATRWLLLNDSRWSTLYATIQEPTNAQAGDTLRWQANIFPPLHETEELLLRLFIYNSNDSLITSYQKLLPPHSTILSAEYILPDSLPTNGMHADAHLALITPLDTSPRVHIMDKITLIHLAQQPPSVTTEEVPLESTSDGTKEEQLLMQENL